MAIPLSALTEAKLNQINKLDSFDEEIPLNGVQHRTILLDLMKLSFAYALTFVVAALAHSPGDAKLEDETLSLPDLERLDLLDSPSWSFVGDAKFENGRIVLTSGADTKSNLYNKNALSYDTWSIESIFRSMGSYGKTHSGLTLYLVKDINEKDTSFFGGAGKFEGLKVVVDSDSKEGSSLHAFLNDGTVDFGKLSRDELYDRSFGSCLLPYQDSQVPSTLRIASYDSSLLIQVNNQVCLKTKKIQLPKGYKVGLSASTSESSNEIFELMRLKTYSGIVSEIKENEGKVAPRAEIITEYVQLDENNVPLGKTEKPPVGQAEKDSQSNSQLESIVEIHKFNKELLQMFHALETKINGISAVASNGKGQVDSSFLEDHTNQLNKLVQTIAGLEDKVAKLDASMYNLERSMNTEVNAVATSVDRLNADYITQLRENGRFLNDLNKNIEYLVEKEKENQKNPAIHELISGLKYLIFPILILSAMVSFFTFSLRHEIKKKLL